MKRASSGNFLTLSLLIFTALLAANCSSDSDSTNADTPSVFVGATAISAGVNHSCALHQDGTISCWGWNEDGQLGNKTDDDSLVPVGVVGVNDAIAVSAGGAHSCALHEGGTISCWGRNGDGQLGDDSDDSSSTPDSVVGVNDAIAISAGWLHSCAVHLGGAVSCWGSNDSGQLGDGTGDGSSVPVGVVGVNDAIAVSAGGAHSCALHRNGTISCWGWNLSKQLGYGLGFGTRDFSPVPNEVADITDAIAISAGEEHSCAVHRGGAVSCWGDNWYGQLGNGAASIAFLPERVAGLTDATAISAGVNHSCALRQGGRVSCWGWGKVSMGLLGDGTDEDSLVPVGVVDITDAIAISAGERHSCAVRRAGTVSCWGWNAFGQLGNGARRYSLRPVGVIGITGTADTSASEAQQTTTAVPSADQNSNDESIDKSSVSPEPETPDNKAKDITVLETQQSTSSVPLADQNSDDESIDKSPVSPEPETPDNKATAVAAGSTHSCALYKGGSIYCWGHNDSGELGDGTRDGSLVPVRVVRLYDAVAITAGGSHSCALRENGTISCWGDNFNGQLGDGTGDDSLVHVGVVGVTDAVAISAGSYHSCALHEGGTISCWGWNNFGQLGDGTGDGSLVPVGVVGVSDAVAISAGNYHSCALREDGTISCWGWNNFGQLGDKTTYNSLVPVGVLGITDAIAISAGFIHSCALREGGTISCWGDNHEGQLGDRTYDDSLVPVGVVGITDAIAITAGSYHSCALRKGDTLSCWGENDEGQLGDGSDDDSLVPVGVVGVTDAVAISAGDRHSCALHEGGTLSCWGENDEGQLGDRTDDVSLVPVRVVGVTGATNAIASETPQTTLPRPPASTMADKSDTSVTVFGYERDVAAESIQEALDIFADRSGIDITYTSDLYFSEMINNQAQTGNPPDIAVFPEPSQAADFFRDGLILALPDDVRAAAQANWPAAWNDFGITDGVQHSIPTKADLKSLVWYKPARFEANGYVVPETWADFKALVDQMIADGNTPLCVGIESGPVTGWIFADWIAELMLRFHGAEYYDQWVNHEIPFNAPEVQEVWEEVLDLWNTDGAVFAASGSIASTDFADNAIPLLDDDCMMHRQASFFAAFFPSGTAFADGSEDAIDVLYFPSTNTTERPALVAGTLISSFRDAPEVWAVMEYMSTAEYANNRQMAQQELQDGFISGFLSAANDIDLDNFLPLEQSFLDILANANVARFDASYLMPYAVGAGAFWVEGTAAVAGEKTVAEATADIEASWP